ncbi:hypothetical protein FI667_g7405, partial [Globisporangium splendens]
MRTSLALSMVLLLLAVFSHASMADDTNSTVDTVESIFDSAKGIKVGGSVLAIVAMGIGALICVSGYKMFRPTLFVVGFVAGGVLLAIAAENWFDDKSWVVTASWVAFVVGGFVVACLVVSMYSLSIFAAGAAGGVLLAMLLNTSFVYKLHPSDPNLTLIILAIILGIICGALAIYLEKPVLVTATSLVGAGLLVWGVGYFAGDYPSFNDLKQFAREDRNDSNKWVYDIPDAWWAYLAGTLVLFVLGMVIQFRKTGRDGQYHRSRALPARRQEEQYATVQTPQQMRYGNPIAHV